MIQKYIHIFTILQQEIEKPGGTEWMTWKYLKRDVVAMLEHGFAQELHEHMQPFYRCYLWKDLESHSSWSFIDFVAERDQYFGKWATGKIDLMELTERWITLGDSRTLLVLLNRLGQTGYEANWHQLRVAMDEKTSSHGSGWYAQWNERDRLLLLPASCIHLDYDVGALC